MARRVARHVDDFKVQAQGTQRLAAAQPGQRLGHGLTGRPVNARAGQLAQGLHATDMVGVMVRDEDRIELELFALQGVEHRLGLTRIDHHSAPLVMQQPEVVVGEGRECKELHVC